MARAKSQTKKSSRKVGRNTLFCQSYRNRNQREKNKVRRLTKHLARFPNDGCASSAVERCRRMIRGY